jgi:hypothetical protein
MSCFDTLKINPFLKPSFTPITEELAASSDSEYQIKEFGCTLSSYEVDEKLELVLVKDRSNGMNVRMHLNYTGELELVGANDSFLLTFENAKLIAVEKLID